MNYFKLRLFDKRRWHEVTEEIEDLSLFTNLPPGFAVLLLQARGRVFVLNYFKLRLFDKRRWHEVTEEIDDLALFTNLPPGFAVLPLA